MAGPNLTAWSRLPGTTWASWSPTPPITGSAALADGVVQTIAGNGTTTELSGPWGLGLDSADYVIISENTGFCVSAVSESGGTPTVIAGVRGTSGDVSGVTGGSARFNALLGLAVHGNLVYVCDSGSKKIKLLTWDGIDYQLSPSSWMVTDITHGATLGNPPGIAVDGLGNAYVADGSTNKVYILPVGASAWTVVRERGDRRSTGRA